jgi:hypothetical protein
MRAMKRVIAVLALMCVLIAACGGDSGTEDTEPASEPGAPASSPESTFDPAAVAALEETLIAAYTGAADYSRANGNFFARNTKEKGELAGAVSTELSALPDGVASSYATNPEELTWCSRYEEAPMIRIAATGDGDELTLAASDQEILLTLTYAPGGEPEISEPSECEPL